MELTHHALLARVRERAFAARSARHARAVGVGLLALALAAVIMVLEATTSTLQSWLLHGIAAPMTFSVGSGPSDQILFPTWGPDDLRRGYALIPQFSDSLAARNYRIAEQARMSERMLSWMKHDGYPIYPEKIQAGLSILDREGRPIYRAAFPERVYGSFEEIPPVIVHSLLWLENRNLLNESHTRHNPAIEWDRLAKASVDFVLNHVGFDRPQPGGSTLATQLEKFRHSREGRTDSPSDKLKQMIAASLRAYHDGRATGSARGRIILDYVNSVPLSARSDYGEVQGLQDGLWVWFGTDPARMNRVLAEGGTGDDAELGLAYREVLSLFIAQRRPSAYLLQDHEALEREIDQNLKLLAGAGMISPRLRDAALDARLRFRTTPAQRTRPSFAETKATNAIRTRLLGFTGLPSFYDLDRLDLTVGSTIDRETQLRVTNKLRRLADAAYTDSLGLRGDKLLSSGDPAGVIYSFNLYERTPSGNLLRVQADNLNEPLDINQGVKLELGSTAKLRTMCNYLTIVADLHKAWAGKSKSTLRAEEEDADDPIREWAFHWLATEPDTSLAAMLAAAANRTYSANPHEAFYTGGGLHTFENFEREEDFRTYTVHDGLVYSINLVYVRLMRDIVRYYRVEVPAYASGILEERDNPARKEYLARFADKEGKQFLWGFYKKYRGNGADERLAKLVDGIAPTPKRLAVIFRSVRPDASLDTFSAFLSAHCRGEPPRADLQARLYEEYAPTKFNLADRGYLARVHPLELWLLEYMQTHPQAKWDEIAQASADQRQEVYGWLFKSRYKQAQDKRIRDLLDEEAFQRVHDAWRELGYPFERLVPSYATAIGSSADKPAALAELMGILVNDGMRYPTQSLGQLHFAQNTPFETVFDPSGATGTRVMPAEVAREVRSALFDVVEKGTGRRAVDAFKLADGRVIPVGGKTGTGDNRYETYAPGGRLISSKVVNRTATFVFLIGDRYFGTVTAHVNGPRAASYVFTSSLPVALLKAIAPDLTPMMPGTRPMPVFPSAPQEIQQAAAAAGASARPARAPGPPATGTAPLTPAPAPAMRPAPEPPRPIDAGSAREARPPQKPVRKRQGEKPPIDAGAARRAS